MAMQPVTQSDLGLGLPPGANHRRAYVGPPEIYDMVAALQFNLLTSLGLRDYHSLIDIGAGSLRGGRLFITYLQAGQYFGVEPNEWLIKEGIAQEIGQDMVRLKQPRFIYDENFTLTAFDRQFDFLLAQSIFSHASPMQISRCLSEARQVMKPTSIFAATFLQADDNYQGDSWVYPGGVTYSLPFISSLVEDHDLTCVPVEWPHPSKQTWLLITDPSHRDKLPL